MYWMIAKLLRTNSLLVAALVAGLLWLLGAWHVVVAPIAPLTRLELALDDVRYDKTAEAKLLPLRRVDISQQTAAGVTLAARVIYTPTFVVVEGGREIGRITGFINDEAFWGLLDALAAKLERPPEPRI